jgi:hypothetical protein
MRLGVLALAIAAVMLAGCGGSDTEMTNAEIANVIENVAELRVEPPRGPPPPALAEVRPEEVAGAACDFSRGGRVLFVTGAGAGFAKVNGSPVRFAPSGPVGPTGGFYVTDRFSISVGRLAEANADPGATTRWPARLVLTDRRAEENAVLRLEGDWRCGA